MMKRSVPLAVGLSALIVLTGTSAASATSVEEGSDYAYVNSSNRRDTRVCDVEQDGNGVYGQFRTVDGFVEYGDANGSASPCSSRTLGSDVTEFRVCENWNNLPDDCSDWVGP
ncbi:hypothetical protein SAMN05216188_11186 [Lentzea xinjiangensis]|uniref:Secreted protein n=1 Tax=Lentzea xinjiangensis TaxID=402600 RepID=A0A1H9P1X9_9PSEU|nr:hypothetical protein [Lentzea xinjiangensis]SER41583.1 hypothetical protein SAMN05216188_11186 [Lentzea xinjiangensis]